MLPSRLNLISPDKRKNLQRILYIQFIKSALESFVFILCISAITLLGTQSVLQNHFSKLAESLTISTTAQAEKSQQVKKANRIISQSETLQSLANYWSETIVLLGNAVPDGVIVSSITASKDEGFYTITGNAATRNDLLSFQTALQNVPFIDRAIFPISQLTNQTDIDFVVEAFVVEE